MENQLSLIYFIISLVTGLTWFFVKITFNNSILNSVFFTLFLVTILLTLVFGFRRIYKQVFGYWTSRIEHKVAARKDELKSLKEQQNEIDRTLRSKKAELSKYEVMKISDDQGMAKTNQSLSTQIKQKQVALFELKKQLDEHNKTVRKLNSLDNKVIVDNVIEKHVIDKKIELKSPEDIQNYVRQVFPAFPKTAEGRIELERFLARLLQDSAGNFTISQILTMIVSLYEEADQKRDKIVVEIKKWVDEDSFVKRVSVGGGVTKYKLV